MIELALNTRKPGNYAFFCPVSNLHLTVSNPVGFSDRVTSSILRGVQTKTIIDVKGVIDLETGAVKDAKEEKATPVEPKNEQPKKEEAKVETPVEPAKEETKVPEEETKAPEEETVQETTPASDDIFAGLEDGTNEPAVEEKKQRGRKSTK